MDLTVFISECKLACVCYEIADLFTPEILQVIAILIVHLFFPVTVPGLRLSSVFIIKCFVIFKADQMEGRQHTLDYFIQQTE